MTYPRSRHLLKPWQPLLAGICHTTGFSEVAFGLPTRPRRQTVTVVRIDLKQPKLRFFTTPHRGVRDTIGVRLTDFLHAQPASVGINANFCCPDMDAYKAQFGQFPEQGKHSPGIPYSLIGLAMSDGEVVSSYEGVPDEFHAGATAVMITKSNRVSIQCATKKQPPPTDTWIAVSGGPQPGRPTTADFAEIRESTPSVGGPPILLKNGINMAEPAVIPQEAVAARTAVGLSKDGNTMYWMTIDDIDEYNPDAADFDPQTPQIGAAFYDVGEWFFMMGAYQGTTLDGGKSSTIAYTDMCGKVKIMNQPRPRDGETDPVERIKCVGNFLGVQSAPLL